MPPSFVCVSYFSLKIFIFLRYPLRLLPYMPFPLEKVIDGQIPIRHSTRVKVSSLIVTFFNGMGMSDYESKHSRCLGTEKKFRGKVGHKCKTQGHLCTLSRFFVDLAFM